MFPQVNCYIATRIRRLSLIVDAVPLVALGDARDPHHAAVRRILEHEAGPLIIPAPVTAEVDYLLHTRGGPGAARRFLEDLAAGRFLVEGLRTDEHGLALAFNDRYAALSLGLADLSVVVRACRHQTRRLLTFDGRDFRPLIPLQGGAFTLLPADLLE